MNRHAQKAFDQLKAIGAPVIDTKNGSNTSDDHGGHFILSAEDTGWKVFDGVVYDEAELRLVMYADFYGEYRGGDPWVDPDVEKICRENDLRLEWCNPGVVVVYDA